jgi:hypothetical protein
MNQTATAATPANRLRGLPAIIDFTTATVWCVVPGQSLHPTGPGAFTLRLKYPAFAAQAYTLEGGEIPATGTGDVLSLDPSPFAGGALPAYVILKVPGVGGLAKTTGDGRYTCAYPTGDNGQLALFQLHLPASARVESVEPEVIQTAMEQDKLIITLAANLRLPQLYE